MLLRRLTHTWSLRSLNCGEHAYKVSGGLRACQTLLPSFRVHHFATRNDLLVTVRLEEKHTRHHSCRESVGQVLGTHSLCTRWEQAAGAWAPLVCGAALFWGGKATAFVLIPPRPPTQAEPCSDSSDPGAASSPKGRAVRVAPTWSSFRHKSAKHWSVTWAAGFSVELHSPGHVPVIPMVSVCYQNHAMAHRVTET